MKNSTLSLPPTVSYRPEPQSQVREDDDVEAPRLPRVRWVRREGQALQPWRTVCGGEVLSVDLMEGCVHQCACCSEQADALPGDDDIISVFAGTAEWIDHELRTRPFLPRAVLLSPTTDPFPPLAEVQAEAARVVDVLARHGVETWIMTRGYIRPAMMDVLAIHRHMVRVTVGMTTLDRELQRAIEPLAAPPSLRLRQLAMLWAYGIPTDVALEPLIPEVTDTEENLDRVIDALSEVDVRRVKVGYLFLRDRVEDELVRALGPLDLAETVQDEYAGGPVLVSEGLRSARYLPRQVRERTYERVAKLAARRGIEVAVSELSNPDFMAPAKRSRRSRLLEMLQDVGRRVMSIFA